MGKVVFGMMVSLDGRIASPAGDLAWSTPDEYLHRHFNELEAGAAAYLYGRRLYETMAAHWPAVHADPAASAVEREYAAIWTAKPKIVFSRTLTGVSGNARLAGSDLEAELATLREDTDGDLQLGGAELARTFMQHDLIDEYRLYLHPVVLGGGPAMFGSLADSLTMSLAEVRPFPSGVVLLRYCRAAAGARVAIPV